MSLSWQQHALNGFEERTAHTRAFLGDLFPLAQGTQAQHEAELPSPPGPLSQPFPIEQTQRTPSATETRTPRGMSMGQRKPRRSPFEQTSVNRVSRSTTPKRATERVSPRQCVGKGGVKGTAQRRSASAAGSEFGEDRVQANSRQSAKEVPTPGGKGNNLRKVLARHGRGRSEQGASGEPLAPVDRALNELKQKIRPSPKPADGRAHLSTFTETPVVGEGAGKGASNSTPVRSVSVFLARTGSAGSRSASARLRVGKVSAGGTSRASSTSHRTLVCPSTARVADTSIEGKWTKSGKGVGGRLAAGETKEGAACESQLELSEKLPESSSQEREHVVGAVATARTDEHTSEEARTVVKSAPSALNGEPSRSEPSRGPSLASRLSLFGTPPSDEHFVCVLEEARTELATLADAARRASKACHQSTPLVEALLSAISDEWEGLESARISGTEDSKSLCRRVTDLRHSASQGLSSLSSALRAKDEERHRSKIRSNSWADATPSAGLGTASRADLAPSSVKTSRFSLRSPTPWSIWPESESEPGGHREAGNCGSSKGDPPCSAHPVASLFLTATRQQEEQNSNRQGSHFPVVLLLYRNLTQESQV